MSRKYAYDNIYIITNEEKAGEKMNYNFSDKISSLKPSAIREILKYASNSDIIPFAAGNPAAESFPVEDMKRISDRIYSTMAAPALQYGITEGYTPLRDKLKKRLSEKEGIVREFDDLIITSGAQQGIDLAAKVICNEHDTIVVENPSFIGALNAFRANGANIVGVELCDDGVDIEKLEKAFKESHNPKIFYVIPNFQNPAGITTSMEKRRAIYDLCVKYGVIILEDDPYGPLRFAGTAVPSIKSLDTEGIVIYMNTFSKIISAGIRIGSMLAPKDIIAKVTVAKQVNDVNSNQFFQMLIDEFLSEKDLDEHLEYIRGIYRKKCAIMAKGLDEHVKGLAKYTVPEGGLFMWCDMGKGDGAELAKVAIANGLAVVPGSAFLPVEGGLSTAIRINYSTPSDEGIEKGCEILGRSMREYLAKL